MALKGNARQPVLFEELPCLISLNNVFITLCYVGNYKYILLLILYFINLTTSLSLIVINYINMFYIYIFFFLKFY